MDTAEVYRTDKGGRFPASDYAYVPDAMTPSTWKLRLTSTPGGDPDPAIVGAAVAALGKGFRGNKVQIPEADLPSVKKKVRAAWEEANPDKPSTELPVILACGTDERLNWKNQLNTRVQEFYNKNHDKLGRFAPSAGGTSGQSRSSGDSIGESIAERVDKIGILGPSSRFRKRDLQHLSDAKLRKLHAHLETNSRKWGAAVVGFGIVSGIGAAVVGMPQLGFIMTGMVNAFLTRTRERFAVGNEAQRRGIHLKFNVIDGAQGEFSVMDEEKMAEEQLEALLHQDVDKMSPKEVSQALQDALQAIQDLLNDPDEELTAGERKALTDGQTAIEQAVEKGSPSH